MRLNETWHAMVDASRFRTGLDIAVAAVFTPVAIVAAIAWVVRGEHLALAALCVVDSVVAAFGGLKAVDYRVALRSEGDYFG